MGWSPREFWRATPAELYRAIDGWLEVRGIDPNDAPLEPPTRAELDELMARFPDGS